MLRSLQVLSGHNDRVWAVAWSPDGDHLASCSGDKTVRIWSERRDSDDEWYCVAILEDAHTRTVRSICWSPDGRHLASASFDACTAVWEVQAGVWEQVATLEGHENEVKCVAWSPDGNFISTCGRDRSVWIWETLPGNEFECVDVKQGHSQDVKMVAWHPQGEMLVSASYDDSIKVWTTDGDEWTCAQTLSGAGSQGHTSTVWAVAFSPDGSHLASCSDDCTVKVWQLSRGQDGEQRWRCVRTLSGYHSRSIYTLDWSRGGLLATGDGDNCIKVFGPDEDTRAAMACSTSRMAVDSGEEESTALAQGSQQQQGASAECSSSTHDAVEGELPPWVLLTSLEEAHSQDINCVRWHPKQPDLLASASDDGNIKLWRCTG